MVYPHDPFPLHEAPIGVTVNSHAQDVPHLRHVIRPVLGSFPHDRQGAKADGWQV